jgi:PAS domain S-box-containing protein
MRPINKTDLTEMASAPTWKMVDDFLIHQIELALQANQHHFKMVEFDQVPMPTGCCCIDENDCILQANTVSARLLGLTPAQLIQENIKYFIHEDDLNTYYVTRQQSIATAEPQSCELRLSHNDGSFFWVRAMAVEAVGNDRAPVLWVVLTDITNQKQAELALQESRKFSDAILDSVSSQIAVLDHHGTIVAVNQAWQRSALDNSATPGIPANNTQIGVNYLHICEQARGDSSDGAVQVREGIVKVIAGDLPSFHFEYPCHLPTRQRWFELCVTPLSSEEHGVVVTHIEVTDRKKLQAAQLALTVEAEQATSRQQLRELVAINQAMREEDRKHIAREMHDELGQILTVLRMDLSLMGIRFGELDPALRTEVQVMKEQVDRALQRVHDVVTSLRPEALNFGLVPAIEWLCQEFSRVNLLPCKFDPQENLNVDDSRAVVIFRIVQESLTNITRHAKPSLVNVRLGRHGHDLQLEVRDNGCGFDAQLAVQKRSFGLLGMRERAISLGGRLEITSVPGLGTVVALTIPLFVCEASEP